MGLSTLVQSIDDIRENLSNFEDIRCNPNHKDFKEYTDYIRRGSKYIAYESSSGTAFVPSRLVGYKDNNFKKHARSENKHGSRTNSKISSLLKIKPNSSNHLELKFLEFCNSLAVTPYNKDRKYWDFHGIELLDVEIQRIYKDPKLTGTEKQNLVRSRRGQGIFRELLIKDWENCCLTGIKCRHALRASHIKPWSKSTDEERLDPFNGLLLTANMDALFDRGLISFKDDGKILRSNQISETELKKLGCPLNNKVKFKKQHVKYLNYHRKYVFKK